MLKIWKWRLSHFEIFLNYNSFFQRLLKKHSLYNPFLISNAPVNDNHYSTVLNQSQSIRFILNTLKPITDEQIHYWVVVIDFIVWNFIVSNEQEHKYGFGMWKRFCLYYEIIWNTIICSSFNKNILFSNKITYENSV